MTHPSQSPQWRGLQRDRLLKVAAKSRLRVGFGWLNDDAQPDPAKHLELWINARMTYVFSRAAGPDDLAREDLRGEHTELAAHGIAALRTAFHDRAHDGWFSEVSRDGEVVDGTKACYGHAFVILAAATATRAAIPEARELLDHALRVHRDRFWDPRAEWCLDTRSPDWATLEPYRGGNAAMHSVEAWLAATHATGDHSWLRLARSQAHSVMAQARHNHWRLVEHFDASLSPDLDYNRTNPHDPFRPYGATPGHAYEWARLLLELEAALETAGLDSHQDTQPMSEAARALFERATNDVLTDQPGLPYTTDWSGDPVVSERFHWVMCEAVMAAAAMLARFGDETYAALARRWWQEIADWFLTDSGAWVHELSPTMDASDKTWRGHPDAYHAYNALTYRPQ